MSSYPIDISHNFGPIRNRYFEAFLLFLLEEVGAIAAACLVVLARLVATVRIIAQDSAEGHGP